jgi:tRNA/rRNA methyltransferase
MVTVIVIEPETSGNLGSIARVMDNFDMTDLVLVNPKCAINEDSRRFAKNAQSVLKHAKVEGFDYLKKFDYLVGTTSKLGEAYNLPKVPLAPDDFASKVSEIKGKKVGLVIGREGNGLYNNEVEMCDFIVSIPTSRKYDSMNVSHALAILLYELKKSELKPVLMRKYVPASQAEKEQVLKLLDAAMNKMDFADERSMNTQRIVWKRILAKSFMTRKEATAIMGFLKKIK